MKKSIFNGLSMLLVGVAFRGGFFFEFRKFV